MNRTSFGAAIFLIGAAAVVSQSLLLREFFVVFHGNELSLGMVLGCWLLGVAAGARISPALMKGKGGAAALLWFVLAAFALLLPLEILLTRNARLILQIPAGQFASFFPLAAATLGVTFPVGLMVGLSFPAAAAYQRNIGISRGREIGFAYVCEAAGSLAGGAILTFLLIPHMGPVPIAFGVSLALACSTLLLTIPRGFFGPRVLRAMSAVLLVAVLALFFSKSITRLDDWSRRSRWNSIAPQQELVVHADSRYQNIQVGRAEGQYNVFGNGQYATSFPDEYTNAQTAHFVMCAHPSPENVLLIGGGAEGALRHVLEHGISLVDYVEIDPVLIGILSDLVPEEDRRALSDPRVGLHLEDARKFVMETGNTYDLVWIRTPDPSNALLNRFYTREFYMEIRDSLRPGGVVIASISSSENYLGEAVADYAASLNNTMRSVFTQVQVSPGEVNTFFASDRGGQVTFDLEALEDRYLSRGIQTPYFSPAMFRLFLPPDRIRFLSRELSERGAVPVNTDFEPMIYFFNLLLWDRFAGGRLEPLLRTFGNKGALGPVALTIPVLILLAAVVLFSRGSQDRLARNGCRIAIGTTGYALMSMEMILLYGYQNLFGYTYQMIGLMVGLFMMGLAIGAIAGTRISSGARNDRAALLYSEAVLALMAILSPLLLARCPHDALGQAFVFTLLILLGVAGGFQFPVAAAVFQRRGGTLERAAGSLDSLDHLGAALGALTIGVLSIPMMGAWRTCAAILAAKLLSFLCVLVSLSTDRKGP